jgi:hypothetical protein
MFVPFIYPLRTDSLALYVATTVIKWDTLQETVTMSPYVLSASKVVTLEIIVNNILLKRHDAGSYKAVLNLVWHIFNGDICNSFLNI